jgi:hypothetical protein
MRQRAAKRDPSDVCTGLPGIPLADLLSEPIKIAQSPRLTVIMYEAGNSFRQIYDVGVRQKSLGNLDGEGLGVHLGVVKGHVHVHVSEVAAAEALCDAQRFAMRVPHFKSIRDENEKDRAHLQKK